MTGTSISLMFQTGKNTYLHSPHQEKSRTSKAYAAFSSRTINWCCFRHVLVELRTDSATNITTSRHLHLAHSTDVKIYLARELNLALGVAGMSHRKCGSFTRCAARLIFHRLNVYLHSEVQKNFLLGSDSVLAVFVPGDNDGIAHTPSEDTVKS